MRISMKKTLSVLLAVLLLMMIGFAAFAQESDYESEPERYEDQDEGREPDEDQNQSDASDGDEAEEPLDMVEYFAGSPLDLTPFEGQAVLINFFTEWCPYCMEEMPDIKKAFDTYHPDSLEIILVHPWDGENADNTAAVVERYELEGVTAIEDPDFTLTTLVGVPGYPTSIFISPDGYLYYAVASKIDFELISAIFDDMGVPLRGETEAATVSTPSRSLTMTTTDTHSTFDADTGATP